MLNSPREANPVDTLWCNFQITIFSYLASFYSLEIPHISM